MIKIRSYIIKLLVLAFISYASQTEKPDSLINLLSSRNPDSLQLRLLMDISEYNLKTGNSLAARKYINEALKLTEEKKIYAGWRLHKINAEMQFNLQLEDRGYSEILLAKKILQKSDDINEQLKADILFAKILIRFGKFSEGIEIYNQCIFVSKEKKISGIIPVAYYGLAGVSLTLKKPQNAAEYYKLLIKHSDSENNKKYSADGYSGLGNIATNYDSNYTYAIFNYQKAIQLKQEIGDTAGIASYLSKIGWNYYKDNKSDSALSWFKKAIERAQILKDYISLANSYGNIGVILRERNDFENAVINFNKGLEVAFSVNDWFEVSWIYKDLSILFQMKGDFKSAYEYLTLHKQYSDSLTSQRYSVGLADAIVRYETEKKESELEMIALKLKENKYFTYGLSGLIVLLVVVVVLFIRQIKINEKRKMSELNRKISEITQKNLRQQMNPHFIFNTLNSIQYFMYQNDKISTNNYLTKFSNLIRRILENSEQTTISIKDELDAITLYLELEKLRFKDKFSYEIVIDENIDTIAYRIPSMFIHPYVENAIVHGLMNKEKDGKIFITMNMLDDVIECIIEDNGIGRAAALEIKNRKNKNHNSLGTKITETRINLVNELYGPKMKISYLDLYSPDGTAAGTKVQLHIPVTI